jgi:hypothetical protein
MCWKEDGYCSDEPEDCGHCDERGRVVRLDTKQYGCEES